MRNCRENWGRGGNGADITGVDLRILKMKMTGKGLGWRREAPGQEKETSEVRDKKGKFLIFRQN